MTDFMTREVEHKPRPGGTPNGTVAISESVIGIVVESRLGSFVVQVDKDDYPPLSPYRWYVYQNGYTEYAKADCVADGHNNCRVYAHRLITGFSEVDHENHDGLDNRRDNLRLASRSQNIVNCRVRSRNTSGYTGVSWDKRHRKWEAYYSSNNKKVSLGLFSEILDAAEARFKAVTKEYGEFAPSDGVRDD